MFVVLAACADPAAQTNPTAAATTSIYWSDGDSGRIDGMKFRLANVDAPETGGVGAIGGAKCEFERELGFEAKEFMVDLTRNADLVITSNSGADRYDREVMIQVLINLIKNSFQAFDEQTNRLVEVSVSLSEKSRPIISVKDNGNGIDEEALEKIFIPFFTTKKTGSGIGLSLSRQIMRRHQGTITVRSKLDEGTEFQMRF